MNRGIDHARLAAALADLLETLATEVPELSDRDVTWWALGTAPGYGLAADVNRRATEPFEVLRRVAEHAGGGAVRPRGTFVGAGGTVLRTHVLTTVWRGVPLVVSVSVPERTAVLPLAESPMAGPLAAAASGVAS